MIDQTLTAPPTAPSRAMAKSAFNSAIEALIAWYATQNTELTTWQAQANALAGALNNVAAGTAHAIPYTFSATTADADPGAGVLRLDNATQNAATTIRADLVGTDGKTWTSVLDSWDDSTSSIKGQLMLMSVSDPSKWLAFTLTSIASPSGYRNITVAPVASSAASPFANGEAVILKFTAKGDKGDTGSGGVADMLRSARTSNTILAAADKGKFIDVTSGTFTQTFNAAASLLSGWWCIYRNSGTGVITLDPSGAETINGASTMLLGQGDSWLQICDGASVYALPLGYSGDDCVTVHTGNGHGSTNTKIRRFTTAMTNTGSAITYADSATNGASFTVNAPGLYAISYTDTNAVGISVNSAQLTTSVLTMAVANRAAYASGGANLSLVTAVVRLSAGDVVRPHTDGNSTNATDQVIFSIRKISHG